MGILDKLLQIWEASHYEKKADKEKDAGMASFDYDRAANEYNSLGDHYKAKEIYKKLGDRYFTEAKNRDNDSYILRSAFEAYLKAERYDLAVLTATIDCLQATSSYTLDGYKEKLSESNGERLLNSVEQALRKKGTKIALAEYLERVGRNAKAGEVFFELAEEGKDIFENYRSSAYNYFKAGLLSNSRVSFEKAYQFYFKRSPIDMFYDPNDIKILKEAGELRNFIEQVHIYDWGELATAMSDNCSTEDFQFLYNQVYEGILKAVDALSNGKDYKFIARYTTALVGINNYMDKLINALESVGEKSKAERMRDLLNTGV